MSLLQEGRKLVTTWAKDDTADICYLLTASEDTEDFVSAVVRSRVCELFEVITYRCSIYPITNQNLMSSH
jgi:hypothetical protein